MREKDPVPTFSYLIQELRDRFPNLAYLHLVEAPANTVEGEPESNDFAREIWGDRPLIAADAFQPDTAKETVENKGGLIAFGKYFISNVR